ncbi:hypothetical protein Tco_1151839, partial [Tanacetum coccineum]
QESSKKQKVDDDKETTDLKQCMEIIPDEEEVTIDAIPLADCRQPLGCVGNVHKTSHELANEKDCLVLMAEVAGNLKEYFRGKLEVEVAMVEEKVPWSK